jgi:UDP-GlcNAc:undecaprenyl-phosphate GlcNAc-1-phosphate transferase
LTSYLVVFGASAGAALLATPLVRYLAVRFGAIDRPSDRKVHPRPTPTLGGVAIFVGVLVGFGVSRLMPEFSDLFRTSSDLVAVLIGSSVIVVVGAYDDIRGLAAPTKVSGQVLAAGLVVLAGVQLLYFWFPGQGILSLGADVAVPLTILWILAMVNALNLIDGLDGLAAGIAAIAAGAFFVYILLGPGPTDAATPAALLCAIAAGGAVGFLPWNFHPARIFMGDSGAMLLGLLLAGATISGVGRNPFPPGAGDLAAFAIPVVVPLLVLAVPFLDVLLAIIRRMRRGRPVTHADKQHIHHRLLDIGHSHRQAVLLMYLWSALISGSALAVALIDGRLVVGSILIGALAVFGLTVLRGLLRPARHRVLRGPRPAGAEAASAVKAAALEAHDRPA